MTKIHESLFDVYSKNSVSRRAVQSHAENDMWKLFTLNRNNECIDSLEHLTSDYNARKHQTIGMRPIDINSANTDKSRTEKIFK